MKTIKLELELTFKDEINSNDEIATIAKNVKNAIISEIDSGMGIAPDETYTTKIEVYEPNTKTKLIEKL